MQKHAIRSISLAAAALLAACGGDDTTTAAITVSTYQGPAVGLDVVFHDAEGQPTSHMTTDSEGRASAEVDKDAMITVLVPNGADRYRATFMGVQPGDELTFVAPPVAPVQVVGTANVMVEPYAGASVYIIDAACSTVYTSDVSSPIEVEIRSNCQSADGTFHVLVTATDDQGNALAATGQRDIQWVDPMHVTMPEWADMADISVDASNAPAGTLGVVLQVDYDVNRVMFSGGSEGALLGEGQGATLSTAYAPGFADRVQSQIGVMFGESTENIQAATMLINREATPAPLRAIDLAADLLPRLSLPTVDTTDPARPEISWTAEGSVADSDGGALRLIWSEPEAAGQDSWGLLMPPSVTSPIQLPALPAELASWAPTAQSAYDLGTVWFVDAEWVASYDELRTGVGLGFVFGKGDDVFPDSDTSVRVTMSGDL